MQESSSVTTSELCHHLCHQFLSMVLLILQITYQAIVSSDGNASFASFVFDQDGIDKINNLQADKVIGFDAGDTINSATIVSPGFSSLQTLEPLNTFRIDGV